MTMLPPPDWPYAPRFAAAPSRCAPSVVEGLARIRMPLVVRDPPGLAAFLATESAKFASPIEATGMRRAE